jgi:hypothetical protein
MSLTMRSFDLRMMVRAPVRVEGCAKIAMTVLRSICTTMGLLRQPKRPKLIFTGRGAMQILLIMKWARNLMQRRLRSAQEIAADQSSYVLRTDIDAQAATEADGAR